MKREYMWIGSLFLAVLLLSQLIHTRWNENRASEEAMIDEQAWAVSPVFQVGDQTMIGQPSKIGIMDPAMIAGKQMGIHWFLWGEPEELVSKSFALTARTQGSEPISIVKNSAIAYGTDGADAQVPTLITIPSPGTWKFDAYVGGALFGSIVIEVLAAE